VLLHAPVRANLAQARLFNVVITLRVIKAAKSRRHTNPKRQRGLFVVSWRLCGRATFANEYEPQRQEGTTKESDEEHHAERDGYGRGTLITTNLH
jgi:hypothetical protein